VHAPNPCVWLGGVSALALVHWVRIRVSAVPAAY